MDGSRDSAIGIFVAVISLGKQLGTKSVLPIKLMPNLKCERGSHQE
jgi:hypothetical protein